MAEDPHNTSDISEPIGIDSPKEDAETKATREELKQTVISDTTKQSPSPTDEALAEDEAAERKQTPELDAIDTRHENLKEQISSPKKKRAHEEVEEQKDTEETRPTGGKSNASVMVNRTDRTEPEKKRPRDKQIDDAIKSSKDDTESATETEATKSASAKKPKPSAEGGSSFGKDEKPTTSASAFASSGFAKLSSTTSPFGALGGSSKPSVFGASASGSASPFGALGAAKPPPPTLSFGPGTKAGAASPFASLKGAPSAFGSAFGSGFGSSLNGPKLTSFGKPGGALKSDKPARPFGTPVGDSDEDSALGSEDEEEKEGEDDTEGEEKEKEKDAEEVRVVTDEKKKPKLQRVIIETGEAGEATILQLRAKLFYLDKDSGWKERGAGMLKVNVPERCVEFGEDGNAIAASFDASTLHSASNGEEDEGFDEVQDGMPKTKLVRLIMRQDSTHRVLLNTALLPTTTFQERQTLKATTILFTAFEGEDAKPVNVQIKMNAVNATTFLAAMNGIQKEMRYE